MPKQRKVEIVEKLKEKAGKARSLVFTNYQGLTHKQLEELKKAVKNTDAELVVTKNTLLTRALQASSIQSLTSNLEGPTATLFAYSDILAPLKELAKTIRLLKLPTIKFGVLEGKTVTAEDVIRLATLPSREVLIAQVIGGLKTPLYRLHRALNWNIQKLAMTLENIKNQKANIKDTN